jgi:hypothetical protein
VLCEELADQYHRAPLVDARAWESYRALRLELVQQYAQLQAYTIEYCLDVPYTNHLELLADIERGHLWVGTLGNTHPWLSKRENLCFRAVHDILGHGVSQSDYTLEGEIEAWRAHTLSALAQSATFAEVVGQAAWFYQHGTFPLQKACLLPQ